MTGPGVSLAGSLPARLTHGENIPFAVERAGGIVRLVDIAPEQPGGLAFIREVKDLCAVSIAHTTANYDQAKESFDYLLDSGANYVVVLNADDTIAGIVTKTSVARSVAENLWGESK